jgi:hypothetical protein
MAGLTGILACDPGWKGLALTLFVPSLHYYSTRVFPIQGPSKAYKRPTNTIPLLVDALVKDYWDSEPRLRFVNKIIIESQHKLNMQQLSWFIHSVLLAKLPNAKVEYISPLHCKRAFGVELEATHYKNKKAMLEYVKANKENLVAGETVTTHDSADSIILLNTFLKEKKRRICLKPHQQCMKRERFVCPCCGKESGRVYRTVDGDDRDRSLPDSEYFITCTLNCAFNWLGTKIPHIHTDGTIGRWVSCSHRDSQLPVTKKRCLLPVHISE